MLESITRRTILELAREQMSIEPCERDIDRSELYAADEAFFCGTGWELTPVTSIDGLPVGTGKVGPVVRRLQQMYFDVAEGRVDDHPDWRTAVYPGVDVRAKAVRLIQLDIAVKDNRAKETGWVFGTFIFNGNRSPGDPGAIVPANRLVDRESVWNQIEPVGLMWGNDPSALSSADLRESVRIKDGASEFQHLGCLDRLNGPVDNPEASCMACHALARFPPPEPDNFPMAFPACVGDDGTITAVSAAYFRNLRGDQVIDDIAGVKLPDHVQLPEVTNLKTIEALDYSLQLSFGMINFCNFWKDQQHLQSIKDFCQWDTEQVADDRSVIGDRTLTMKAALVPEMSRQSR